MRQVGLIRVLTTEFEGMLRMHGDLVMSSFPGLNVISQCIPDQPDGIHDEETELIATPKVLELAADMERRGMEAVIISCAGDPGVDTLAKTLKIPVIGAGRAVASAARSLELPVGVLGLTKIVPEGIRRILGDYLVADTVPEGVESTLDLMTGQGKAAVIEAGRFLKSKGSRALALACTGMSTIGIATALAMELGMPVIDPVKAEGAMTWLALGGLGANAGRG